MMNDVPGETLTFDGGMAEKKPHAGGIGGRPLGGGRERKKPAPRPSGNEYTPEKTEVIREGNAVSGQTCVGWLLAIRGPNKGRSYEVFPGQNSIGRSQDCVVTITADDAVSKVQCVVGFDHIGKEYFICGNPNATAITRINGKRLYGEQPLVHGSIITLSDDGKKPDGKVLPGTVLRFVPACDDQFSWDMAEG